MEKKPYTSYQKIGLKGWLTLGALSVTLTAGSPKVISQTNKTSTELFDVVTGDPELVDNNVSNQDPIEKVDKNFFIHNFAKIINHIKSVDDFPYMPKYKNPDMAKKYGFPNKIDISPKYLDKPKDSIVVTLGTKMYEITPFFGKQIMGWKILNPQSLDDPKVILTLKRSEKTIEDEFRHKKVIYKTKNLSISSNEFSKYIHDISAVEEGDTEMFFTYLITVREVSKKNKQAGNKNTLAQNQ